MQKCPCQSGQPYDNCCHPIISNQSPAPSAEQLMRSRYTAFCIADINYLMRSHHKSTRPLKDKNEILQWTKSVQWIDLKIISKSKGTESDSDGYVEFKAFYIENGSIQVIHENSYFVKENGIWYYKNGKHF